jgi:hypothetical protein
MKKVFYRKEGRKYVAVSEYDDEFMSSIHHGNWLVSVYKGGSSRRPIDPAFAPMIAAASYSKDVIAAKLRQASELRPSREPLTLEQFNAWGALSKAFGEESSTLNWPAAHDAVDAAINAMREEADKLLTNPAVRKAYDHFMLVCELTKEHNDRS